MSLDFLELTDFTPQVGTVFAVPLREGGVYPLTLTRAAALRAAGFPGGRSIPFDLRFHGPGPDYLPQQIHLLRHDVLGDQAIALVPLGPTPDGAHQYQATFD
ncbi:hypothetical protein GALL_232400 [mine drainage metagenome]|uniref:DUF6916 domain-containing protein n=1 Tax=mine drainage metagenome TaxID=410659 RepID=A0A1J5RF94_9ZZZZ